MSTPLWWSPWISRWLTTYHSSASCIGINQRTSRGSLHFLEFSLSSSWWSPLDISKCENTVDPLSSTFTTSSIVGCWVCLRSIAWFATRISSFRRIWLRCLLGLTTSGDTHPVGSLTVSMIFWSRRCWISFSIFSRTLKGSWRDVCATGLNLGSTFKAI